MPEINQYVLNNKELLALIIKETGCHEGKWVLMASFGISPGNYGPSIAEAGPGVAVAISKIGIQRADSNTPEEAMLDATVINPPPKASTSRRRKKS